MHLWCLVFSLLFVKNRRFYDIAHVAKLSFLAKTRNLMIMACRMLICRRHCAVIGIRSLVLARDDGVAGTSAKLVLQGKT